MNGDLHRGQVNIETVALITKPLSNASSKERAGVAGRPGWFQYDAVPSGNACSMKASCLLLSRAT